jgi:hypothetical protein
MLMALYHLFQMFQERKTSIIHSLLFVLFLAGSILSKGPVSLYVLFLSFVIAYGIAYKFRGGTLHFLKLISLVVFGLVLGGWWYFHVRVADPETFTAIAARETSNWSSYNVRPFYYYWSFFVQSGIWTVPALMSLLYPYMKSRVSNLKAYRFSFFWTIIAVILLSIIPEKKSRYLMPVLIPLAINIGFYIQYLVTNFKTIKSKKDILPVYFQFGLIGSIAVLFPFSGFFFDAFLKGPVLVRFLVVSVVLVLIGFFIFKQLREKNIKNVFYLVMAFMLSLGLIGIPLAKAQLQADYKPLSTLDRTLPLYTLGYASPEVIYNYGEKIPNLYEDLGFMVPSEKEFLLISVVKNPKTVKELNEYFDIQLIDSFDLNFSAKDSRSYKSRLVNKLYKITRK